MNKMFPLKSFFSGTEKRKEKKNSRLSGIPGYLLSIGLCAVFALYCSGRVGWFLVLTFICAPILSLLFTLLFRKQITAACMLETPLAAKGEHGILTVSLQSKGFLPSPFVTITFTDSPYLTCGEPLLTLSLLPRSTETVSFNFTASVCGASFVGIKEIRIWDYLGLFSFTAPVPNAQEIHVVPDIAEVSSDEDYILEIYRQSAETGDSEETIDAGSTLFGGFPGFEHREYVPGDPLKRINWKLSAKRDKLYVRLDEETASSRVCILLDTLLQAGEEDLQNLPPDLYAIAKPDMALPLLAQNAMETSLGIARALLHNSLTVSYLYLSPDTGDFREMSLRKEEDIPELAKELAAYSFSAERRILPDNLTSDMPLLICTPGRTDAADFRGCIVYSALTGKGALL